METNFDEKKYYMVLKNDEELLNKYLYNLNNDILKTPHILFIKPIISGYILSEKSITIILRYIKNKGIDFNSEDYFQNRNDDLQGVDLISGCLCFTIYYFVQNKKIFLEQQDIAMYSAIVINARKMGWEINNSHKNKKNIQDLLLILISNGHNEIQPIYNALFEDIENVNLKQEEVERHVISDSLNQSKIITESKQDNNFSNSNKDEITGNNHNISETLMVDDSINNFIILLNSLAINGFIDNSFLNKESQISSKIYNMQKSLNYESAEKMLERFGFKVDTIEGGVEYDIFKGDVFELNTNELRVKDDFLNSNISNFSTRTYNRLKRYGVRTYDDLLNLNIDEFKYSNGVGVGVIEEVQKRIREIQFELLQRKVNASIQNTCNKDSIINFTWQKFFEENDYFKSLFNVSIPACKQRGESLSHIWLKSDNHYIIKNFMNELKNAYLSVGTYKKISLNGITKPADLASLLTELEPGDLVEIEFLGNIKSEVLALLKEALNDFTMTVVVGKGHTARKIVLNLPPFTAVFISEYKEKMFNRIAATIDIKIEPKISDEDLFKLEILDSALKNNLQLTEETLSFLMDYLQNKHINSVIKLLADYLYLHSNILQPISSSQMKTIL